MESKTSELMIFETHISSEDSQLLAESLKESNTFESMSQFSTPNKKLSAYKTSQQVATVDMHHSSGGYSSDLSLKDGSESSSPLSCDSESADFYSVQQRLSPYSESDGKSFRRKVMDQETDAPIITEKLQVKEENETYEELLGRIAEYEDEQRVLKQKLKFSEEEMYNLQCELKKSQSQAANFQARLDSALDDIVKKTDDLDLEKRRASEQQTQLTKLEVEVSESNALIKFYEGEKDFYFIKLQQSGNEIVKLNDELARKGAEESYHLLGQLELAQQDIAKLDAELQLRTERHLTDSSAQNHEIAELAKALQNEAREREYEKMNMQRLYKDHEMSLQEEIHLLKVENVMKGDLVECLNKDLDMLKLKHDMVTAEKDNIDAKLQTVMAEKSSQNNVMRHMEDRMGKLITDHLESMHESILAQKLVDELAMQVQELQSKVDGQRVLLAEAAEEKKEAIRQLCFALEHYRGWYHELRLAFAGPSSRRLAVTA